MSRNKNTEELISQFFKYLSYLGNPENKAALSVLQKYLDDECLIQSNREILCRGIHEFIAYSHRMQEKYTKVRYSDFLEEPIISGKKAVLYFLVYCSDRQEKQQILETAAILTIRKGKICSWKEVFQPVIAS